MPRRPGPPSDVAGQVIDVGSLVPPDQQGQTPASRARLPTAAPTTRAGGAPDDKDLASFATFKDAWKDSGGRSLGDPALSVLWSLALSAQKAGRDLNWGALHASANKLPTRTRNVPQDTLNAWKDTVYGDAGIEAPSLADIAKAKTSAAVFEADTNKAVPGYQAAGGKAPAIDPKTGRPTEFVSEEDWNTYSPEEKQTFLAFLQPPPAEEESITSLFFDFKPKDEVLLAGKPVYKRFDQGDPIQVDTVSQTAPASEVLAQLHSLDPEELKKLQHDLWLAGILTGDENGVQTGVADVPTLTAYAQVLQTAVNYQRQGVDLPLDQLLADLVQAGAQAKKDESALSPQAMVGGEDLASALRSAAQALLGRDPTDEEIAKFTAGYHSAEQGAYGAERKLTDANKSQLYQGASSPTAAAEGFIRGTAGGESVRNNFLNTYQQLASFLQQGV